MPRTTRAAARAQETGGASQLVFEDADTATQPADAEEASQQTLPSARPIFGEIAGNTIPSVEPPEPTVTIYAMPAKKVQSKKGRPATKRNKLDLTVQTENDHQMAAEVLDDENQSDTSDAADAAAEDLRRDDRPSETFQVPMDNKRPRTPPSAAAKEATNTLLRSSNKDVVVAVQDIPPNTPQFDPAAHEKEGHPSQTTQEQMTDSFVEDITTRSPTKATPETEDPKEDSFVQAIIARSPAKTIPRIEDSVAEMDALDDAIEKVAEILPVLGEPDLESPSSTRDTVQPTAVLGSKRKPAPATSVPAQPRSKAPKVRPSPTKMATRPIASSAPRPSTVRVKPTARASVLPSQPRAVSAQTASSYLEHRGISSSASPAKAPPNTIQTIRKTTTTSSLSTSKPGFVPAKSTKPTTTSRFTLPGEAIAAKLKAQREERQKREEEAASKEAGRKVVTKPAVAAKAPPRLSTMAAPVIKPRETKTSQARRSLMGAGGEKRTGSGTSNKENVAPPNPSGRPARQSSAPFANGAAIQRTSGVNIRTEGEKVGTTDHGSVRANSAIRRTGTTVSTSIGRKESIVPSPSSCSVGSAKKSATTKAEVLSRKGKEIVGRNKGQKAEMDRLRRDKEEAAKKARKEAAERGRVASREWAEKQKKRIVAAVAEAAKNEQAAPAGGGVAATGSAAA